MKPKGFYWKIKCCQHTKTIFSTKIKTNSITEKKLVEFIQTLMAKYALSDNEILEQHVRIPFKPKKEYISIQRYQNIKGEIIDVSYYSQSSDISVEVFLTI
jgi:hypothetical protein